MQLVVRKKEENKKNECNNPERKSMYAKRTKRTIIMLYYRVSRCLVHTYLHFSLTLSLSRSRSVRGKEKEICRDHETIKQKKHHNRNKIPSKKVRIQIRITNTYECAHMCARSNSFSHTCIGMFVCMR